MERVRQRKSKTSTIIEGNQQVQKHKGVPKLASESSSSGRGTTKEDSFMFELGRSSSKRVTGTPMKKLLAEEMSKETEAKKRSPSVIARLMGLDGLPSPQPVYRQQKRLSDNYQQRTASTGFQRNDQLYEGRSSRKSSTEQQEFKDVYEDLEASHVVNPRYSSNWTENSKLTKPEMALNTQNSMDAKHLSTDDLVQSSKEFHDNVEILDYNNDLMLKFLQQPDSLFVKHMHDLQGSPSSSICSHIAVLKPSNSAKYEANAKGWKSERKTSQKPIINSHVKHEDCLLSHPYNGAQNSQKSSKNRLEGKPDTENLPTRIVLLKPNIGKMHNPIKYVSSPDSSHAYLSDCSRHTEYSSFGTVEAGSLGKKDIPNDVGFSKTNSREAREIAKVITRQMRDAFGSRRINSSYSGIREYSGDESSYNMSGSDSASESEVKALTSRNSLDRNSRHKPSSSGSTESSVSREAKKRLSERWKLSHRFQDVEVVGKGSTLGEMLAVPDREMKPENMDAIMGLDGSSDGFASNNGTADWDSPLGISSRDGWKDGYIRNSSRSRSLPPPFRSRSHKTSASHEALVGDRLMMPKEVMNQGRSMALKGNFNQNEDYSSKNSRYSNKKSQSSRRRYAYNIDYLPGNHPRQNEIEINLDKDDPTEQQSIVSQTPNSVTSTSAVFDAVVNSEHESITVSLESSDELLPKLSPSMLRKGDSSVSDQEDSNSQEPSIGPNEGGSVLQSPGLELESSESSKEADHFSPVSVLEVPSTEDVSSGFECFERVSADIHELRMQLQLLKMESEAYTEVPMLISSDEDVGQGSIIVGSKSWESSYLVDVLIESGFDDGEPDMFTTTWHSPNCPLGPWVFANLEKTYHDETTGLRPERRLLFDRVNAAFLEIFQWFLLPCPWVKPVTMGVGLKWRENGIKFELHKLLAKQEKEASEDISEKLLDREMHWLDFGEGIDVIGMEIEKMLIDDLITEVVTM